MYLIKLIFISFFVFSNQLLSANDLFNNVQLLNNYLKNKGIKITEYRASVKDFEGYELITNVIDKNIDSNKEPIKRIVLDKSFQHAVLIYQEELVDKNLQSEDEVELIHVYNTLFKQNHDFFYSNYPLFLNPHTLYFNNQYNLYHNSDRAFLINKNKTKIFSVEVLNLQNNSINHWSKDVIEKDISEVRELVNKAYGENEFVTKVVDDMENLVVVFFSKQNEVSINAFNNASDINNLKYGLMFLPYYDINTDVQTTKDYQQFCQIDFFLNTELALISPNQEFSCPDTNQQQVDESSARLLSVYNIRNHILSKFYLNFDKPYFYLYKEKRLINYDLFSK